MSPTEPRWPDLIYVNGPSSAGKTTLSRGVQSAIAAAYPCIGFDDFVFTSAPRYYLGADTLVQTSTDDYTAQGVEMVTTSAPGEPVSITAVFGPVFRRLILSMPAAVRALVDGGNHTIFDDVLHDPAMYANRQHAFAGLDVFTVGVRCDLACSRSASAHVAIVCSAAPGGSSMSCTASATTTSSSHGYDGAGSVRDRRHVRAGAPGGVMIGVAPSRVARCRCALSPAR